MPRYGVSTFLNPKEMELVDKIVAKENSSRYKVLRKGVLKYCHDCLKEEKENVGEIGRMGEEDRNNSGSETERVETKDRRPPFLK